MTGAIPPFPTLWIPTGSVNAIRKTEISSPGWRAINNNMASALFVPTHELTLALSHPLLANLECEQ
jgi:hypothetical protein